MGFASFQILSSVPEAEDLTLFVAAINISTSLLGSLRAKMEFMNSKIVGGKSKRDKGINGYR